MKTRAFFFSTAVSLFLILSASSAQEHGKIYNKTEADELYGKVFQSEKFSKTEMQEFLSQTNNLIMFRFENENLIILGDNRTLIQGKSSYEENNEIFRVFSKSKVIELLNLSKEENCIVEQRKEVLTITSDNFTLELGDWCPPFCN